MAKENSILTCMPLQLIVLKERIQRLSEETHIRIEPNVSFSIISRTQICEHLILLTCCRAVSLPIPVFDPVQINTFFMALLTTAAFGFGPVMQFFRVRIISTHERQHENSKDGRKAIKKDDPSVSLNSASKAIT